MKVFHIGDICTFSKGASVPRDRMTAAGDYLYLHYGDLYKGHQLYIDIEQPQKPIPSICRTEKINANQYVDDGDIIYILTSETVEDLGKALLLKNPKHRTVVSGTETTIMRVMDKTAVLPSYLNYAIQNKSFQKALQRYATGMKVFRVHPRDLSRMPITIPDIRTQQRVVTLLDSIYSRIVLNNRINDYLAA